MNKVLTICRRRLFSKRAREYMVAYSILDNNNNEEEVDKNNSDDNGKQEKTKPQMTAYLIEKIVKQYKSHRSAADFDAGFINGIVDRMRVQQ
jgi:DNA modification methylase